MLINPGSSAMASALRLPELLTLIGTYLDPPNLLRCVQVSLFWNMAFIPVLWRTIDDTSYSWPRVIKDISSGSFMEQAKKEERLRNIYGKYGAHIRDFRSSGYIPIVIAQASGSFVNLHTLAVKSIEKVMFQEARRLRGILRQCGDSTEVEACLSTALLSPVLAGVFSLSDCLQWALSDCLQWALCLPEQYIFIQRFWLLVSQNPMLERIRFGTGVDCLFSRVDKQSVGIMLASLPNLTRLDNHLDETSLPFSIVLEQLPHVQHYATDLEFLAVPVFNRTFLQTRSIHSSANFKLPDLLSLLAHLPNLEQLWVKGFTLQASIVVQSLSNTINTTTASITTTSRLLELHITDTDLNHAEEMDRSLADVVLPRVPCLTSLSLRALYPRTATSLGICCPKLQCFQQLDFSDSIYSRESKQLTLNIVGTLLHQCPNLKTLDAIDHSIEAEYLLAEPWVCRELQTFRCQITGMNRLTGVWLEDGHLKDMEEEEEQEWSEMRDAIRAVEALEKQKRCRKLHERVYGRLAEMVQLKVLNLGKEFRDFLEIFEDKFYSIVIDGRMYSQFSLPIANTLELSLESGLGQLSSLKNLEVFGFEGVDHRIGTKELTWMAASWPRLKIMRGLNDPPFAVLETFDNKTLMLKKYMEELRPFVKHEGLDEHPMIRYTW